MRVDPNYITNLTNALDQAQVNAQQYSSQMASGLRVNAISQDPLAAGQNILLLNQVQQDDSFTQSCGLLTGQLQVADAALGQVVSQMTTAISLATRANSGTLNANDRASLAQQIAGVRDEVLSLANTNYQGQYLFGGGKVGAAPFSLNTATSPATVSYAGDQDVNYLQRPNGQMIQMNVPGDQIFTAAGAGNVFAVLNSLVADYSTANLNQPQAAAHTAALTTAMQNLSLQRVTLDNSITQLTAASTASTSEKTQLMAAQTSLMQADVAVVATQLSQASVQQQALEAVIAKLAPDSLFDHMR